MLINCVAYENGARLADLEPAEISDYLERPGCFVWVALHDASEEELALMQEEFQLHELAVEDARHGHQRPKIEDYGDSIFVVMHLLSLVGDELKLGELNVFVGANFILSVRNRDENNFSAVRLRCEKEPQLLKKGAGFVLYALMDATVDRYFPILDRLETELEEIEEQIFTDGDPRDNIERLYGLKAKAMILRHAVSPLAEESGKLLGGRVPAACANCQEYFRDVHDHLIRINAAIDSMRETIVTAIQVNLSIVAIKEGEVNKKLAAWAGIFAAATAFAGIWGMNFKSMPELDWKYGYPLALSVIVTVSAYLYYRFKRAGWL